MVVTLHNGRVPRVLPIIKFSWYNVLPPIYVFLMIRNCGKCLEKTFWIHIYTDRNFWIWSLNMRFWYLLSKQNRHFIGIIHYNTYQIHLKMGIEAPIFLYFPEKPSKIFLPPFQKFRDKRGLHPFRHPTPYLIRLAMTHIFMVKMSNYILFTKVVWTVKS